jgi:hypothetical protein
MGSAQILKGMYLLFFCLQMLSCTAQQKKSPDSAMQTFHVARIIGNTEANYMEVTFLESARFYRILKNNKHYNNSVALLHEAEKNKTPLLVSFTEPNGDVIEKVERVSSPKKE